MEVVADAPPAADPAPLKLPPGPEETEEAADAPVTLAELATDGQAATKEESEEAVKEAEEAEMPGESAAVAIDVAAPEDEDDEDDEDEFQDPINYLEEEDEDVPTLVVPPTLSFSVNEMEVVTNRGGRAGSLSRFLDDADSFRRRSLPSYPDELGHGRKKMTLEAFLDMAIDPVLEILEDTDSDIRLWLTQPETVKEVLAEFVTPPVLSGEPHEEYGYYKKHFLCSEIIMKLYTGEEDLYESFSSDSSSGSTATTAVFGCQEDADIEKWALLYSVFDNPAPLDEMQLLFFSKALVRLHDGFCLEEGYVANVLKPFLPRVVPHLYSNTIKYMLTLILQSYESVHPITGRNDAMEIAAPLLAKATRVADADDELTPENLALVENTSNLLVDMLQANQADRLGAFCRREGGVYLSKYFVRDQFGTIRGFESMTHGYHNFLQYMLLEELAKHPEVVEELFANAVHELATTRARGQKQAASALNVHIATELLTLCTKLYTEDSGDDDDGIDKDGDNQRDHEDKRRSSSSAFPSSYSSFDQFPSSPRESSTETSMYNLAALARGRALWSHVRKVAQRTASEFVAQLDKGLPSSVEISLAKYLNALVTLHDRDVDMQLHEAGLIPTYLNILKKRSTFDMLLIHVLPAISFVVRDADGTRSAECLLTRDLFAEKESVLDVLLLAKTEIPALDIYAAILHDVLDEVLSVQTPSVNNLCVLEHCKASMSWQQLLKITGATHSETSSSSERGSDERSSSVKERVSSAVITEDEAEQEEEPVEENQEKDDVAVVEEDSQKLEVKQEEQIAVPAAVASAVEVATKSVAADVVSDAVVANKPAVTAEVINGEDEDETDMPRSSSLGVDNQVEVEADEEPAKEETGRPSTGRASRISRVSSVKSEKSAGKSEDSADSETVRKSTHYLKQVLQSPVFKTPMRLGGVIKTPSPQTHAASSSSSEQQSSGSTSSTHTTTRNSFGWNSMFKKLRKSLVTTHTDKPENKKLLALSNEPFAGAAAATAASVPVPAVAPRLTDVLVVDTSKGEDVTTFVHRDGGVVVTDVPLPTNKHTNVATVGGMNVVTSGYMYKSKLPETGQRHLWERYYFVLNRADGSLSYYISETHAKDRTFVRGTSRPVSVSEGIPVHVASGQRSVYGFQINTQGHGCFMVLVDSIDSRLTWLTEIVACVSASTQQQQQRLSLLGSGSEHSEPLSGGRHSLTGAPPTKLSKQELKELVVDFYRNLFGPNLKFSSPMDAPASFWMEEKIDPVSEACVLRSNLPDCVPYWGEFHGYKRLCDYWKTRDETVERSSGRVLRVVVDEDEGTAVVLTSTTYRVLRNSEIVTEESCDIVNVTNGAISSIHCTFDSHRIAQAFKKEGVSAS